MTDRIVLRRNFRARLKRGINAVKGDRRGVAAVEFALLAPILLCMYFMTLEASQAIETDKKVGRVGSMVADLVTQQQSIKVSELQAVMRIGKALLQPYNRSDPTIKVTGIQITDEAAPRSIVLWSQMLSGKETFGRAYTPATPTTVPEKLRIRNSFLVRVESELGYKPVIAWAASDAPSLGLTTAFNNIPMGETYYLRPRMTDLILCSDC